MAHLMFTTALVGNVQLSQMRVRSTLESVRFDVLEGERLTALRAAGDPIEQLSQWYCRRPIVFDVRAVFCIDEDAETRTRVTQVVDTAFRIERFAINVCLDMPHCGV